MSDDCRGVKGSHLLWAYVMVFQIFSRVDGLGSLLISSLYSACITVALMNGLQ